MSAAIARVVDDRFLTRWARLRRDDRARLLLVRGAGGERGRAQERFLRPAVARRVRAAGDSRQQHHSEGEPSHDDPLRGTSVALLMRSVNGRTRSAHERSDPEEPGTPGRRCRPGTMWVGVLGWRTRRRLEDANRRAPEALRQPWVWTLEPGRPSGEGRGVLKRRPRENPKRRAVQQGSLRALVVKGSSARCRTASVRGLENG